jgi:ABC-type dipeptide/oligopeptide/nickel transport system ATPase component
VPRTIGDVILEVDDHHTNSFTGWGVKAVDGVSFALRQGRRWGSWASRCGKTMTALSVGVPARRPHRQGVDQAPGENLSRSPNGDAQDPRPAHPMILQDPQTPSTLFTVGNQLIEAIKILTKTAPTWCSGRSTA